MRLRSVLSALGIAVALVIGLDYVSFAATGNSLVLGKINKSNKATAIKRTTNGPAVSFVTKPNQPPFAVNRNTKVGKLNADLLDGRDSSTFAAKRPVRVFSFTAAALATNHTFELGPLPAGRYLISYQVTLDGSTATSGSQITWGQCAIVQSGNFYTHTAATSGSVVWNGTPGPDLALSGSGMIDTAAGSAPELYCNASKTWRTRPFVFFQGTYAMPAQVTLTRIESSTVTTGTG